MLTTSIKSLVASLLLLVSLGELSAHNRPDLKGYARTVQDLDVLPDDVKHIKLVVTEDTAAGLFKAVAVRFEGLDSLSVYHSNREGTVAEVRDFAKFAHLRKLDFMGDLGPSDEVILEIAKLKKLESLSLYFGNS